MSALASSSTKENTSSNTGEQKEDHSTKTIPQLRSHLGLAVKSSKSKAAKGSKKQYYSKVELIELANSSSTVIASKAPVEVIELANSSNESTVIASKAPVNVENNDDNTKTSSDTTTNNDAKDGFSKLFQSVYDSIVCECSFDLFVKMNPTKEDIFKYMKNPIKLSDKIKIRKQRGLKKKRQAMAFIANVNRIIEELRNAKGLSEKDYEVRMDDLLVLKTSEEFLKEKVEREVEREAEEKRERDLEELRCQSHIKVSCKDCDDSHCTEKDCDGFDDRIYKCGVCETTLCECCDLLPKCGVCEERFCESCMIKDSCDGCYAREGFYRCAGCAKNYCSHDY